MRRSTITEVRGGVINESVNFLDFFAHEIPLFEADFGKMQKRESHKLF